MTGETTPAATAPGSPTSEVVLAAVVELSRELHLELSERELVDRTLSALGRLFPACSLALRVLDLRSADRMRVYCSGGALRPGLDVEPITIKDSAVSKTGLKSAVIASARLRTSRRWDSPFFGGGDGFAIPLVAAGELYGVLDVGYPGGAAALEADEHSALPLANTFALAVRNQHLYRDTALLRDYQSRLIESAGALIMGIDRTWRIAVFNRAMIDLTGFSREEIIGRDLRDLLASIPHRSQVLSVLAAALEGADHSAISIEMPKSDGSTVRTVWTISPVGRAARLGSGNSGPVADRRSPSAPGGDPDGSADGAGARRPRGIDPLVESVVMIGQDQSRVHALQQQVIRAERLATIGELAAGVVHELNNPLTSITVYAEYLQHKLEAEGRAPADLEKLRRIGASAQRILRFSRELVQFARPATSEVEAADLRVVVEQSLSFCEHLFERDEVELRCELQPVPLVTAIKGQLEQVLINLLTNAVHAIAGRGVISIRVFVGAPGMVSLEIDDSGPGVAPADRARIFEPFFTTKPDGKGTGLGLSIVRNIIDQHSGTIAVSAAPLGGARFTVTLPSDASGKR
jgi:two-component system, NtrC family, sensor kinase